MLHKKGGGFPFLLRDPRIAIRLGRMGTMGVTYKKGERPRDCEHPPPTTSREDWSPFHSETQRLCL